MKPVDLPVMRDQNTQVEGNMFGNHTVKRNFKRCSSSVFSMSHDRFNVRGTIPPQSNFKGQKTVMAMAKGGWEFAQCPH